MQYTLTLNCQTNCKWRIRISREHQTTKNGLFGKCIFKMCKMGHRNFKIICDQFYPIIKNWWTFIIYYNNILGYADEIIYVEKKKLQTFSSCY